MSMISKEKTLKTLLSPHLSEKVALVGEKANQYAFKVLKTATKLEIKLAVESLFKTTVKAVTVVNVKSKQKRFGQITGTKKAWKKAYVTLAADQKLDLISA